MSIANDTISIILNAAKQQVPVNICWMTFGSLAIICNITMAVTILKTKSLHSKSQFVVVSLCIWETFNGLSYAGIGTKRYMIYALSWPEQISQTVCFAQILPLTICGTLVIIMTTSLGADRFLAVAFPVFYNSLTTRNYIFAINGVSLIYTLITTLPGFYGTSTDSIVAVCTGLTSSAKWYSSYTTIKGALDLSLMLIFYSSALIILRKRIEKTKKLVNQAQRVEQRRRLEIGTFRMVLVILMVYLLCITLGYLAYPILQSIPAEMSTKLSPVFALLLIFYSISHLLIYLIMSSKFRTAFMGMFFRRFQTTEVTPVIQIQQQ